jgi:hypothetical protein
MRVKANIAILPMKHLITLSFFIIIGNLYSQDIIVKKNGTELQTRVLKVEEGIITYNKYHSHSDSIFSIATSKVVMIKYESGVRFVFDNPSTQKQASSVPKKSSTKKSLVLGARFALGSGAYQSDILGWFDMNTATNIGGDLGYFFNDYIGLKTGVSYLTLPFGNKYQYSTSVVGIPAMIMVSIGDKLGFYSETGAVFYFQSNNSSDPFIAVENFIGIHGGSGIIDVKLGFLLNFTIKGQPKEYYTGSIFMGLNAGISVYL